MYHTKRTWSSAHSQIPPKGSTCFSDFIGTCGNGDFPTPKTDERNGRPGPSNVKKLGDDIKFSYVYKSRFLCKSLIKNHKHFFAVDVKNVHTCFWYGEIILFQTLPGYINYHCILFKNTFHFARVCADGSWRDDVGKTKRRRNEVVAKLSGVFFLRDTISMAI